MNIRWIIVLTIVALTTIQLTNVYSFEDWFKDLYVVYSKEATATVLDEEVLQRYPTLITIADYGCIEKAKYRVLSYSELIVVIHKTQLSITPTSPKGSLINATNVTPSQLPQCIYLSVIDKGSRSTREENETLILVFDKYTSPQLGEPKFTLFNNVYLPEITGVYIYADKDILKETGVEYARTFYRDLTREYGLNVSSRTTLYFTYNRYIGFLNKLRVTIEFKYQVKTFMVFEVIVDLIETNAPLSRLELYEKTRLPAIIAGVAVALGVSSIVVAKIIRGKTKPKEFYTGHKLKYSIAITPGAPA